MKVLDSTFLVEYARGKPVIETYLNEHDDEEFVTSAITIKELAVGAHLTGDPTKQEFLSNFAWLTVIPFDEAHAFHAGLIEAKLRNDSNVFQHDIDSLAADVLIGAVARSLESPVVTRNVDDFERFDGVRVEPY